MLPVGGWLAAAVAILCYVNSLQCTFCFDDLSAVVENQDLRGDTPLTDIFRNDFWGTPMSQDGSHKSYRPLTVASFRINYSLGELNPLGYHLMNVLLHAAVCYMFVRLSNMVLKDSISSSMCGLLFAVHPIHTEAVAGIVGRAESLSAIFFIATFVCYTYSIRENGQTSFLYLICSIVLCIVSTLCKEQGITVVAVCCVYDLFVAHQVDIGDLIEALKRFISTHILPDWFRPVFIRCSILLVSTLFLMFLRIHIMGAELPVFTQFDNPAAVAPTPTRQLTFAYLLFVNAGLLLLPLHLCCDWTMQTIPLIESITDWRNFQTIGFFVSMGLLGWYCAFGKEWEKKGVIAALSLLVFPFIPASNLFFPVGFVVAERILYVPSMGFILLVVIGWRKLRNQHKHISDVLISITVVFMALKTIDRNPAWFNDEALFKSAIIVNPKNAKLYNNLGHVYEDRGDLVAAESYFHHAVDIQPDDIGSHINMGRVLKALERFDESEASYQKAMDMMPRLDGEVKKFRVAPSHINVYYNLANLIKRDPARIQEAEQLYRTAIRMKPNFDSAHMNLGDLLLKTNRIDEAEAAYKKVIEIKPKYADAHFNLGVVYLSKNSPLEATTSFRKALSVDPNHTLSMVNLALLLQESKETDEATRLYQRVLELDPTNEKALFNLGLVAMDMSQWEEAEKWFQKTVKSHPDSRSSHFNLALLYSQQNRHKETIQILSSLVKRFPSHTSSFQLLGDSHVAVRQYKEAVEAYLGCMKADSFQVSCQHNIGVAYVELGQFEEAKRSFQRTLELDPNYSNAKRHLQLIKQKIVEKIQQDTVQTKVN